MATLDLYPDSPFNIKEAFYKLGTQDIDKLHVHSGIYGERQGVYGFEHPGAPDGTNYEVIWDDGAIVDFGIRDWTDKYQPGTMSYRYMKLGQNFIFTGPGLLRAGLWVNSRFRWEDFQVANRIGVGIQELTSSEGGFNLVRGRIYGCGIDPTEDDPIWSLVARVPVGTILTASELTFDVHEAVAQAGMTDLVPDRADVPGPDIVDTAQFFKERQILRSLCKQLGYKGNGEHGFYATGGGAHVLREVEFDNCSGYSVYFNGKAPMQKNHLVGVKSYGTAALYATWNSMYLEGLEVVECETWVHRRGMYEPKDTFGFVLNNGKAPEHRNNIFHVDPGPSVYACRLWGGSPFPSGDWESEFFTPEGTEVPVYPSGSLPTKVEPQPEPEPEPEPESTIEDLKDALFELRIGIDEVLLDFYKKFGVYPKISTVLPYNIGADEDPSTVPPVVSVEASFYDKH